MNPKIKQARNLRTHQTSAEKIIWQKLRNRQFQDLKFRRQYKIGNFIVDFYCERLGLIIELDGDVHVYKNKQEKDKIREEFLRKRNFNIIRYTNNEIYNNLDSVMEDLCLRCEKLIDRDKV